MFAKLHANSSWTKWRIILWSDESKTVLLAEFNPKNTFKTAKHGGSQLGYRCALAITRVASIHWIKNLMNATKYADILENQMCFERNALKRDFMYDNDPKHMSKNAKEWLGWNLRVVSAIARFKFHKKRRADVKKTDREPSSQSDLLNMVRMARKSISVERCQKFRRCASVINNKSFATKY